MTDSRLNMADFVRFRHKDASLQQPSSNAPKARLVSVQRLVKVRVHVLQNGSLNCSFMVQEPFRFLLSGLYMVHFRGR